MTRNVYLFGTCVIDLFMPQAGLDAVRVLERPASLFTIRAARAAAASRTKPGPSRAPSWTCFPNRGPSSSPPARARA
jgi:hypothetical protein